MSRTAVVICPGRGTYNKAELGYLARHHPDKIDLFAGFDNLRKRAGQPPISELDAAETFSLATHTRGDIASPLIYASSLADARSLADDIDVVAVTGNSMGWYIALAVAEAVDANDGFRIVNTMGTLMQEHLIGGQLIYPFVDDNWREEPGQRQRLLETVQAINARDDCRLALSINLGGMLVLAGDEAGLAAFESSQPKIEERFPMRLPNHAAFHTALQAPVAKAGQRALAGVDFRQPARPIIDGRGCVWWPDATDLAALRDYTLGHQVTEPYDFTAAVTAAAREFAPDLFIITGPGATLGGAVAQALIFSEWEGLRSKADFQVRQAEAPLLVSMGMPEQRSIAIDRHGEA
ncbi:MAG: ACP S-malonyltransferase [Pseudomonadota bacterium]